MKITPVSILAWASLLLAAFLFGMFIGRNVAGGPIQTSVLTTQGSEVTPTSTGTTGTPQGKKVNINTASLQELMTLDGIGETYAQRIIDYRTVNGPFTDISQLKNVAGIGDKRFDAIKDFITVGG